MKIRRFRAHDAPFLAELFHASVRKVGIRDYSEDQVTVWSPDVPDASKYIEQASDGRLFLVAVDETDRPVAYGDLESDGHIDHLYCSPEAVGSGIASAIYHRLEEAAIEQGMEFLFVEASEAARRLFERRDFQIIERQELMIDGVIIHNYRMNKAL